MVKTALPSPIALPPRVELPSEVDLLRSKLLQRLQEFKQYHLGHNRTHATGLRGVSWIYANLNGALIASPGLAKALNTADENGVVTIRFVDVSLEQRCPAEMANLVSIYVRLSGPELIAVVAQPIAGKCEWEAKFILSIPGAYTVLARLLHYNGIQDVTRDCSEVTNWEETSKQLSLLHSIVRYPNVVAQDDCQRMCIRFKACTHSLGFGRDFNSPCYLFTNTSTAAAAAAANNVTITNAMLGEPPQLKFQGPVCQKMLPFSKERWVLQLGCGRDEMLMRWAPCAAHRLPRNNVWIHGVEDMILFEYEHANILIDLDKTRESWTKTLDEVQREFDASHKTVCNAEQLGKWMPFGRWTRSPVLRVLRCGALPNFESKPRSMAPRALHATDPLCNLRFELDKLNGDIPNQGAYRWRFAHPFFQVWKTELSDSYLHAARKSSENHGELWTGYFRLPPQAECAMPPMYTPARIRQCVEDKNLVFTLYGRSIIADFSQYFVALLDAAFPGNTWFPGGNRLYSFPNTTTAAAPPPRHVFVTDFIVPNIMSSKSSTEMREHFESELRVKMPLQGEEVRYEDVRRVFLTPRLQFGSIARGLTRPA